MASTIFPIIYGLNPGEFEKSNRRGAILIACAVPFLLAIPVTWAWLPEVPGYKAQAKSLEELGKGIKEANVDGQVIGFRRKCSSLFGEFGRDRTPSY